MSGKRAKKERRRLKNMMATLEPILPILEQATREIYEEAADENPSEIFSIWANLALDLKLVKPDIDLEDLLPSNMHITFARYESLLAAAARTLETTGSLPAP